MYVALDQAGRAEVRKDRMGGIMDVLQSESERCWNKEEFNVDPTTPDTAYFYAETLRDFSVPELKAIAQGLLDERAKRRVKPRIS